MSAQKLAPNYLQQRVVLDQGVVGVTTLHSANPNQAGVLMLHGFASHKDEVGGLFENLAQMLTHAEIASLRIDFRGWGESSGDMSDTTVDRQLEDAQIAYEYLGSHPQIDSQRLGVLGFSLGGGIAVLTAGANPAWFKSMATWSCIGDMQESFQTSLGKEVFGRGLVEDEIEIDLGWRTVRLKKAFFNRLGQHAPLDAIRSYPGSFFALAGSADHSANHIESYYRNASGSQKEKEIIMGADHIFNILDPTQNYAQQALDKTTAWFKDAL